MNSQAKTGYSKAQITLHWIIAAFVIFQLLFGENMTTVVDAVEEGENVSATDQALASAHYWIGLAILVLVFARLALRLFTGAPPPARNASDWMQIAARVSHAIFYVLLFLTPIIGLLAFYEGGRFGDIHALNKPAFIILISIHVIAALYHQFWLRDGTLTRIVKPAE